MGHKLTQPELERIEAFAKTPKYAREPDMLLPNDADHGNGQENE